MHSPRLPKLSFQFYFEFLLISRLLFPPNRLLKIGFYSLHNNNNNNNENDNNNTIKTFHQSGINKTAAQ